jgi:hypoxanthine phosphoribosyltransferase
VARLNPRLAFEARLQTAGGAPARSCAESNPGFAHSSEREFAALLDSAAIHWEYEPRSFPLQWNKDAQVTEAFTPDFYLPEFDLYVELTVMKQALVTRKNRKVRLLQAIYPHINIHILYHKDLEELARKRSAVSVLSQTAGS